MLVCLQANLTVTVFGLIVNILPLQTIFLDPSTCPALPPPVTPTTPPVTTPPPTAEDLCTTLFDIANNISPDDSLTCRVVLVDTSCTTLVCEIQTQDNSLYEIDIRFALQESDVKAYVKFRSISFQVNIPLTLWEVTASNGRRQFALGSQGSTLTVTLNTTTNGLLLEVRLL